jgi:hybrid cluster-associated redox disulfide protein
MKITKEMGILDAVNQYPDSVNVFQAYGMHCFGCMAARFESIEEGAIAHGIDPDELIKSVNNALDSAELIKE